MSWELSTEHRGDLEKALEAEAAWHEQPDLFPSVPGEETSSAASSTRSGPTGAFLTIIVDGKEVVLRDVPRTSWFGPYVRDAANAGLISGYRDEEGNPTGEYRPAQGVSIEELAKISMMFSGGLSPACGATRNESAKGSWSAPYIGCAEARAWALFADAAIDVKRPATRAEVIMNVLQAFDIELVEKTGTAFKDVTLSTEFAAAIERAKRDGIVSGFADDNGNPTGFFGPTERVSRAEMAKIAVRAQQIYGR